MQNVIKTNVANLKFIPFEETILMARMGDEEALNNLFKYLRAYEKAFTVMAMSFLDYDFTPVEKSIIYETTIEETYRHFSFQARTLYLNYFLQQLRYAFQNYRKTKGDLGKYASGSKGSRSGRKGALSDYEGSTPDLKDTVTDWIDEFEKYALLTHRLTKRELMIGRCKLCEKMTFKEIAAKFHISVSTAKKAWRKYLDLAKEVFGGKSSLGQKKDKGPGDKK